MEMQPLTSDRVKEIIEAHPNTMFARFQNVTKLGIAYHLDHPFQNGDIQMELSVDFLVPLTEIGENNFARNVNAKRLLDYIVQKAGRKQM